LIQHRAWALRAIMRGMALHAASPLLAAALALAPGAGAGAGEARVSLDARDAPIVDIVRVLAEAGGFQVVFDPGLECRLTLKLHETRWRSVLDTVLSACRLGLEEEGDILRVAKVARLQEEAAARRRLEQERRPLPSGRLALFRLSYARAQQLAPLLDRILTPAGRVSYDSRSNTLLVAY
jgi:type IV pilus assembly protein PilQ